MYKILLSNHKINFLIFSIFNVYHIKNILFLNKEFIIIILYYYHY